MANKEIAELTAAATLNGAELVHVVQGGNSRKTTTNAVAALILIDEDSFATNSATLAPSQQSVKAYIPTALNASGAAPIYAARAWVNFNGTGTVAIRGSGNVSSITDDGTGKYTVNLATGMPNVNYCPAVSGAATSTASPGQRGQVNIIQPIIVSTSALQIATYNSAVDLVDYEFINVVIFG